MNMKKKIIIVMMIIVSILFIHYLRYRLCILTVGAGSACNFWSIKISGSTAVLV